MRWFSSQIGKVGLAKLVRLLKRTVLYVVVDIIKDSPTFGKHLALELSEASGTQLYIPRGFAHGFLVLSESAVFFYKCDNYYNKQAEAGIMYNDLSLNIDWRLPDEERNLALWDVFRYSS